MKVRDSGMPEESYWESFFNPKLILSQLQFNNSIANVAEFGSGYGIFTLPAASIIKDTLYALDIDPKMIKSLQEKIVEKNIRNIKVIETDFVTQGTKLSNNSVDYVMLFNILHTQRPVELLNEAFRILKKGGKVGIIHWKYSKTTPRGPSLEIRPKPKQCINWLAESRFEHLKTENDISEYHYGIVGLKV